MRRPHRDRTTGPARAIPRKGVCGVCAKAALKVSVGLSITANSRGLTSGSGGCRSLPELSPEAPAPISAGRGGRHGLERMAVGGHAYGRSALDMRGVSLFTVKSGRIVSARLYMEEVEGSGGDIDETVRRLS
jgi:hypothetical protein